MTLLAYENGHERGEDSLIVEIKKLIVLETLVAHAYRAVDDLIEDSGTRAQFRSFRRDHERNARALTRCLWWQSSPAKEGPSEPQTCTEGMVGGLTPVMAMWLNEDETARGYEELLERPIREPHLKQVLAQGLEDARNHWACLTVLVQPQAQYHASA